MREGLEGKEVIGLDRWVSYLFEFVVVALFVNQFRLMGTENVSRVVFCTILLRFSLPIIPISLNQLY